MSRTAEPQVRLHHRDDGDPSTPAVVLGPSLGTTLQMWDALTAVLASRWRVIRFDTRGHGESPAPDCSYTVPGLAGDVLELLDELGVDRFAYCGLSLGGALGQQLAVDHPDRVGSLVLCCTAARFGAPSTWEERARRVRAKGTGGLVEATRSRWFTPDFVEHAPQQVEPMLNMLRQTPRQGYAGCCDALAGFDLRARLGDIRAPTLVIVGTDDPATPPSRASELAGGIADAELLMLSGASHLANVEQPELVSKAIVGHLERTWS